MSRPPNKSDADIAFGKIRAGSHMAGYSRDTAIHRLGWQLETDMWRVCGAGYSDINAFLGGVWQEGSFQLDSDEREKLARRIKELHAQASNRAIAHALGANERTIRRDLADEGAANAAGDKITTKEINGYAISPAALAARIEFLRVVNAARGTESNTPVGLVDFNEALATVNEAAFRADPRRSLETLRAILHSIAFLWAAQAVDMGQFLRVAKADLAPADWAEMLNKRGHREDLAEVAREHGKAHIAVAKLDRLSQPQL
jgi:hypothetical protein